MGLRGRVGKYGNCLGRSEPEVSVSEPCEGSLAANRY